MFQCFSHFSGFLHHSVLAKLATGSRKVKGAVLTWFECDKAGSVGAGALREDDDLRPLPIGVSPLPDLLDGVLPRVGVLPRNKHRLAELDQR